MTVAPERPTPLPGDSSSNGILASVPGQYISQASKGLPDPATASDDVVHVELEAGWLGLVRFRLVRSKHRLPRHKTTIWRWACVHAEKVA